MLLVLLVLVLLLLLLLVVVVVELVVLLLLVLLSFLARRFVVREDWTQGAHACHRENIKSLRCSRLVVLFVSSAAVNGRVCAFCDGLSVGKAMSSALLRSAQCRRSTNLHHIYIPGIYFPSDSS